MPTPGHEVYGFLPYWEMDASIAAHVAGTDLSTLALFSVTNRSNGSLDTSQNGYGRISGPLGRQLIAEAHDRGTRVELVFTSFGTARNKRLFSGANAAATQGKVVAALVDLAGQLGVDGINVDVEQIDDLLIPAYGDFVGRLRDALRAAHPKSQVSVATTANERGAAMALAAVAAGVDRIFMMGYDYHWSGSAPGASSPIERRDGDEKDLVWSLDLYQLLGVPVERTLLGLPFYGMAWPTTGPELGRRPDRQGPELDPERPSRLPGRPGQRSGPRRHRAGRAVRDPGRDGVGRRLTRPERLTQPERHGGVVDRDLRRLAGRRSRRSLPWPTSAAWPGPASGRSATNAACPTTRR